MTQVALANKAAALKAAKEIRLLSKAEVLERVGVTFPTIWKWMRAGTFPRSRVIGGQKTAWYEHEVNAWLAALPIQPLKGDDERGAA